MIERTKVKDLTVIRISSVTSVRQDTEGPDRYGTSLKLFRESSVYRHI